MPVLGRSFANCSRELLTDDLPFGAGGSYPEKNSINMKHMRGRYSHMKILQEAKCKFFSNLKEGLILDTDSVGTKINTL